MKHSISSSTNYIATNSPKETENGPGLRWVVLPSGHEVTLEVTAGKGHSCGGPNLGREGKDAWPTLVIEAGSSESLGALRDDMRWWFSVSDHQVNIVLLVKFDYFHQKDYYREMGRRNSDSPWRYND